MSSAVVLGSLNIDLHVRTERAPAAGETVPGHGFGIIPGGKGANQAAAIARLGGAVSMIGRVGNDSFGQQMLENLGAQGVSLTHVRTDADAPSGTALIIVEASGENRIVVVAGANARVDRGDVDLAAETIRQARVLVVQLEVPLSTVEYAMGLACRHSVPILLNSAPAYPVSDAFLARASYLVLNETEASLLVGSEVADIPSAVAAACLLCQRGVPTTILTLGDKGAVLASADGGQHFPARTVKAVDTTGAGDAFVGGFVVSLLHGRPLDEATCFANAAGALAVTKFGAQTALPTAQEVERLMADGSGY